MLHAMLSILPLVSAITPAETSAAVVAGVAARLADCGVAHRFVADGEVPADALLIVSGGTEHLALAACEGSVGPAILLAHPGGNSLPAALEVLSRLQQQGRAGRIVLVNNSEGDDALARLARHLEVRRRLRSTRLGRLGAPSDWLVASMPGADLVGAAWGPTVVDVPVEEVVEALGEVDADEAAAIRDSFVAGADAVLEPSPPDLDAAAAVAVALRRVVRRHRLDACTVRCFDLVTGQGTTGCVALSWLLDEGVVAGCEGDVPAALTMLLLQAMTGQPAFVANPQDLDPRENTLALAHCTIARSLVSRYTLRSHYESSLGVGIQGTIPEGPVTVARVGGAELRDLFASDAEVIGGGDREERCRTQVELRLVTPVAELLARPLGNHLVLVRGHWAAELRDYHELFVTAG
jgi:L-fucose isomerase-like protein